MDTTNQSTTKKRIEITPAPLNPFIEVAVTTTTEFCVKLNDIFSATFDDFIGSFINCVPLEVPVHFPDGSTSKGVTYEIQDIMLQFRILNKDEYTAKTGIRAFGLAGTSGSSTGVLDRVNNLMARTSANDPRVELTEDGKNLLSEFMKVTNNKINWIGSYDIAHTSQDSRIVLKNLDMNKLITKVYGNKDVDDSHLYYQYIISGPVAPAMINRNEPNYSIRITRYNLENLSETEQELGIRYFQIPTMPGINIITKKTSDPSK